MAASTRFDQISRDLARTTTRRQMLGVALAGAAGLFGGVFGQGAVTAAAACRTGATICSATTGALLTCVASQWKSTLCPIDTYCQQISTGAYCKHIA